MTPLPRTEYRRLLRERGVQNPSDSWIAPEHAKMARMRRRRDTKELILPEPECLRAQGEAERRKRLDE